MQPNKKHKTRQNPYYFDTLESTEQLEQSGFTHEQAVAQTKVIGQALSKVSENYTTKQDIELLEERLRRLLDEKIHSMEKKIDRLRSGFHLELLETKNDLESKMRQGERHIIAVIGIATAILGCLMAYLH